MTESAPWCLTLVDTAGIQEFVFGSNRLRENTGGSYLVQRALGERLRGVCREATHDRLAWPEPDAEPAAAALPDDPEIDAELIFEGGGNAAILFRSRDLAVRVVRAWSRGVLLQSPGLRVAVAHADCGPGALKQAWLRCRRRLAEAKDAGGPAPPLEGVSLTRACRSTGLASAGWLAPKQEDRDIASPRGRAARCLSPVAALRLAASGDASGRLRGQFPEVDQRGFAFTDDVERLGQKDGEQSLAVVHADGNGLGRRLAALIDRAADDDALVHGVRAFASGVRSASRAALRETLAWLMDRYPQLTARHPGFRTCRDGDAFVLPLRPIVFGGDDVTFVCHGRLGLGLAARYLEGFAARQLQDGPPLSACAGVAVVHTRAPFSRAYELADALCSSAKRRSRDRDGTSWLDAHVALDSLGEPLEPMRRRRYTRAEARLDWRPWQVAPTGGDGASWSAFVELVCAVRRLTASQRRYLMDALAAGDAAAQTALSHLRFRGRALPSRVGHQTLLDGWKATRPGPEGGQGTPLYDPLELFDYAWEVVETEGVTG